MTQDPASPPAGETHLADRKRVMTVYKKGTLLLCWKGDISTLP
jgi:hypothetical protein